MLRIILLNNQNKLQYLFNFIVRNFYFHNSEFQNVLCTSIL